MAILYAQLIKHTQCWQIAMEISHAAIYHTCRFVHIISFTKFAIECNLKNRNDHSCMQSVICYVRRARHIYHITPRSTALQHLKYWQIKRFLILMYFFYNFFFLLFYSCFLFLQICVFVVVVFIFAGFYSLLLFTFCLRDFLLLYVCILYIMYIVVVVVVVCVLLLLLLNVKIIENNLLCKLL